MIERVSSEASFGLGGPIACQHGALSPQLPNENKNVSW